MRHKWYVMIECFGEGLFWRGIIHDLSKLYPSEFIPYANHFYGKGLNIRSGRDETGYYKPTNTGDKAFDFAWLLHQKRNRHHWQYWILPEDDGGEIIMEISHKYLIEMLCDWQGAGKAQGTPNVMKWYEKNKDKMRLHYKTRKVVEGKLRYMDLWR